MESQWLLNLRITKLKARLYIKAVILELLKAYQIKLDYLKISCSFRTFFNGNVVFFLVQWRIQIFLEGGKGFNFFRYLIESWLYWFSKKGGGGDWPILDNGLWRHTSDSAMINYCVMVNAWYFTHTLLNTRVTEGRSIPGQKA